MINKKNVLGKKPQELAVKDAIHVAIVSVRAGCPISPGQRCRLNEFNEAVSSDKGPGVADPFRRDVILTGENFWLLLDQDAVANVTHMWEHPTVKFDLPTREVPLNYTIKEYADQFKISYQELIDACTEAVEKDRAVLYTGPLSEEEFEKIEDYMDRWELWSEWAAEVLYEFENIGSECCPEYEYPDSLFYWSKS